MYLRVTEIKRVSYSYFEIKVILNFVFKFQIHRAYIILLFDDLKHKQQVDFSCLTQ